MGFWLGFWCWLGVFVWAMERKNLGTFSTTCTGGQELTVAKFNNAKTDLGEDRDFSASSLSC